MTAPGGGGADEIREQLAAALWAHPGRSGFPLACGCGAVGQPYAEHVADVALLPTVQALITKGAAAGEQTVTVEWAVKAVWDDGTPDRYEEQIKRSDEHMARAMADYWNGRPGRPTCTVMRRRLITTVGDWTPDGTP